jgi:uncharacterized repeat protein (TIGR01451 family)
MAAGASVTYTCSRADVTTSFDNVAVATGISPDGTPVGARDSARIVVSEPFAPPAEVLSRPGIAITKNPKSQTVAKGGTAVFTISVTNSGDVELRDVAVSDPQAANCSRDLGIMAPGASVTYTCTKADVKASFDNVAVATGTAGVTVVSAKDMAPVKVSPLKPPKKIAKHGPRKQPKHKKPPKVVSHAKPKTTG